jgi:hypothetical protein
MVDAQLQQQASECGKGSDIQTSRKSRHFVVPLVTHTIGTTQLAASVHNNTACMYYDRTLIG